MSAQSSRHSSTLSELDVERFDAFTVATSVFWRRRSAVVVGYFATATQFGWSAFLVAQHGSVCRDARPYNVTCVVSHAMDNQSAVRDTMMAMERWNVLHHFLKRGRRLVYTDADVRFTRPPRSLFAACGAADAAFDGRVEDTRRLSHFTPAILLVLPTERTIALVRAVLSALQAPTLEGLDPAMQAAEMLLKHRKHLMGPAQQDLVLDVFWSTLYDRPIYLRKRMLAKVALSPGFPTAVPSKALLRDGRSSLPPLDVCATPYGRMIRSPRLNALMLLHGMVRAARRPCASCASFTGGSTFALHCLSKEPSCLDVGQCQCLHEAPADGQPLNAKQTAAERTPLPPCPS